MIKKFALALAAVLALASPALAQNLNVNGTLAVGGAATVTGATTLNGALNTIPGHVATGTAPPVLSSCGTGSPTIVGSDTAGIVTLGTTTTGCIITFAAAYTTAPFCVVTWIATPLATQSYVTSSSAITLTQTSASGNKVQYICVAQNGG